MVFLTHNKAVQTISRNIPEPSISMTPCTEMIDVSYCN